jgi:hypothetical protein
MRLALAAALVALVATLPARADYETIPVDDKSSDKKSEGHHEHESVTYSGIGLAWVGTDFDNLKDAVNLNFALGFRIPTFDWFGAEVEIGTTIIPGEREDLPQCQSSSGFPPQVISRDCPGHYTQSSNDFQMNNIAVYGVFRSRGKFYFMGKGGYRYLNSSIEELEDNRSGAAFGGGVGYRWGESLSGVELYYTHFSSEVTFIGFSISYGFGGHGRD